VAWRCGVVIGVDAMRLEVRFLGDVVDDGRGASEARPVVIPES
jgi:hypothetical protein